MQEISDADKLNLLINHVGAFVYELIFEATKATTCNDAVEVLANTKKDQAHSIQTDLL